MRQSPQARFLLCASVIFFSASMCWSYGESPHLKAPAPQTSAPPGPSGSSIAAAQAKKSPVGPAPPQSSYHPILLLIEGKDHTWSIRIGLKGPERFDRVGYPPIPLDPGEVSREGETDAWTYNAKDSQTGAMVAVHLKREPCNDNAATVKYGFSASVDHAQIGSLEGCGRVATELFPKINNQPSEDDDDDTKDKPTLPTVTNFKSPVDFAYVASAEKMILKLGSVVRSIPGKAGNSLSLSHDGKKLLFVRDEQPATLRAIDEYDFETRRTTEIVKANVNAPFWSPDDSRIAYLQNTDGKWQIWTMPPDAPDKAALFYAGDEVSLEGWADVHTLVASDLQTLSWVGDDGIVKQTLSSAELYGKDQFGLSSGNTVRVHPLNPDLLLVSAEWLPAAAQAAMKEAATKAGTSVGSARPPAQVFFLYEIRSKRRVVLSPLNLSCSSAEWSKDGLQIFFTGRETSGSAMATYRVFWDGTSLVKVHEGYDFVIGQ